jgi:6-phosphogluconolactonase (cycloisomerase 2 family)
MQRFISLGVLSVLSLIPAIGLAAPNEGPGVGFSFNPTHRIGWVFTETNDSAGNNVLVFERAADGSLTARASVSTNGDGSATSLGSEGSVVLSGDGQWLFAVNAGTNTLSVFRVTDSGLTLTDVVASGGDVPIGVTEHDGLVYVLNSGEKQGISGFVLGRAGRLVALPHSTRPLSAAASVGPAQIKFSPDGRALIVTEKTTNKVDSFPVRFDGTPGSANVVDAVGVTPFGFDFDPLGTFVVSDAASGGATSYRIDRHDVPAAITGPLLDGQTAACWVTIPHEGRVAYVANAGSDDLSVYGIGRSGTLTLLTGDGTTVSTGAKSHPTDMAVSADDRFLYALGTTDGSISGFRVTSSGALAPLTTRVDGLPATVAGLAAK